MGAVKKLLAVFMAIIFTSMLTIGPAITYADLSTDPVDTSSEVNSPYFTSPDTATTGMRTPFNFYIYTTGNPIASITESGVLPTGLSFTDNGDGTAVISGTAAGGTKGTYVVTLTADNGSGTPATQQLTLVVNTDPSAAAITSPDNDTETFGVPFNFTVTTDGYPAPKLTKTGALPSGVTFQNNGDGTATISGTPAKTAMGTYTILITATNSTATVNQSFTLTINKAPKIQRIANLKTAVGSSIYIPVTATGYTTPSLSVSDSTPLPTGVFLNDNGDGTATISGTPETGSGRDYLITVNAVNGTGSSSRTFRIRVLETPTITSGESYTASVGSNFTHQLTAIGFPAPKYSVTGKLPKGVKFSRATGTISGTPAAQTTGVYPLTITAKNSQGSATQSFVLTVQ